MVRRRMAKEIIATNSTLTGFESEKDGGLGQGNQGGGFVGGREKLNVSGDGAIWVRV